MSEHLVPPSAKSRRPLIGLLLDWQAKGTFSARPHYALRESYFNAVWQAGGLPVALPLVPDQTLAALDLVQGVLVPGGDYPSPSSWYADSHGIESDHPRAQNSIALLQDVLQRDLPLLAICAGMQELTVTVGGRLHWRIAHHVPSGLTHRGIEPERIAHTIVVESGSLLGSLCSTATVGVNSVHNEGLADPGQAIVSARAPDGVIEAIEIPGKRFAIGVQWHPEYCLNPLDKDLFKGLVAAAQPT